MVFTQCLSSLVYFCVGNMVTPVLLYKNQSTWVLLVPKSVCSIDLVNESHQYISQPKPCRIREWPYFTKQCVCVCACLSVCRCVYTILTSLLKAKSLYINGEAQKYGKKHCLWYDLRMEWWWLDFTHCMCVCVCVLKLNFLTSLWPLHETFWLFELLNSAICD